MLGGYLTVTSYADHDGRARKRADVTRVDAAYSKIDGHRVLLADRLHVRLRIHNSCTRNDTLRCLEQHVSSLYLLSFMRLTVEETYVLSIYGNVVKEDSLLAVLEAIFYGKTLLIRRWAPSNTLYR